MQNMSLEQKRRFAVSGSSDEDPYSLTSGNGSSGSSARFAKSTPTVTIADDKTLLLNKKERDFFVPQNWSATQDRKRDRSRDNFLDDEPEISTLKPRSNNNRRRILKKTDEKKNIADDPYYCGFSARVPNFVKAASKPKPPPPTADKPSHPLPNLAPVIGGAKYREPGVLPPASGASQGAAPALAHIPQVAPYWWHSRLYPTDTQGLKGPSSFQATYFEPRHIPFSYAHTPNEFSSFQFSGGRSQQQCQDGPGSQTPSAQPKTSKKKGFRHNPFKAAVAKF